MQIAEIRQDKHSGKFKKAHDLDLDGNPLHIWMYTFVESTLLYTFIIFSPCYFLLKAIQYLVGYEKSDS